MSVGHSEPAYFIFMFQSSSVKNRSEKGIATGLNTAFMFRVGESRFWIGSRIVFVAAFGMTGAEEITA